MANWKSFNPGKDEYKVNWDANTLYGYSSLGGVIYLNIEFDADRTTPVSTVCRFKITCSEDTENSWNIYYVAIDPENKTGALNRMGGTLYQLKNTWTKYDKDKNPYPFYSNELPINLNSTHKGEFKLTKNYNDTHFAMPEIYIYNEGQGNGNGMIRDNAGKTVDGFYIKKFDTWAETYRYHYTNKNGYRWLYNDALVAKFTAKSFTTKSSNFNNDYKATNVGKGTVVITDNKNSTFSISASSGTAGTNNSVKSNVLTYTKNSTGTTWTSGNKKVSNISIQQSPYNALSSAASYSISATVTTTGTYGPEVKATHSKSILNYVKPSVPGIPEIQYDKNRLTIREDWKYQWSSSTAANSSSSIRGYRIQILKNNTPLTGLKIDRGTYNTGNRVIKDSTNSLNYIDFDDCPCSIIFNPIELGFLAHDTVNIKVSAYTVNGLGAKLCSDYAVSEILEVQNAGIVYVKVNTAGKAAWVEGQVWVKVATATKTTGEWKEAETILAKVATPNKPSGVWNESK